jgi:hypothetical protein
MINLTADLDCYTTFVAYCVTINMGLLDSRQSLAHGFTHLPPIELVSVITANCTLIVSIDRSLDSRTKWKHSTKIKQPNSDRITLNGEC